MNDKPKFDPQQHHRQSIRLKDFDYSQPGAYFITICLKDKECLLGEITGAEMNLNAAGRMIDSWWQKIPSKFPDIELGPYQVMPNHFHAIAINVGADPRVRPDTQQNNVNADPRVRPDTQQNNVNADPRVRPDTQQLRDTPTIINPAITDDLNTNALNVEHLLFGTTEHEGEHVGSPLHAFIQWFKTMTTNEYIRNVKHNGWPAFNGKLWQRNYFEHIIRNEKSFQRIADYIYNNPASWASDNFFTATKSFIK